MVLFIHIPKCGGSSIGQLLHAHADAPLAYVDGGKGVFFNRVRHCSPQHMHAEMLEATFDLRRFDLIFSICRDPVARMKSEFHMRSEMKAAAHGFDAWYREVRAARRKNPFFLDNHLRPQAEFIVEGCRVYRLEDGMQAIWTDICDRLEISSKRAVPHVKPLPKNVEADAVVDAPGEAILRLIRKDYKQDYRLLRRVERGGG